MTHLGQPRGELSHGDAQALLASATFRISLGQHPDPEYADGRLVDFYGTGFFITKGGLALTAYHNFEDCSPNQEFDATYQTKTIRLQWVTDKSSKKADIAVMRLVAKPDEVSIEPLLAAYLPLEHPAAVRTDCFLSRPLAIYGYPQRGAVAQAVLVLGSTDAHQPLTPSLEDTEWVDRICLTGSTRVEDLEGISGAAMLDRELRVVIGVEGSCKPASNVYQRQVLGTEIARLIADYGDLACHFVPLDPVFGPVGDPEAYLNFLRNSYRYLDLRGLGFADRVPLRLELEDLYVPLRARLEMPSRDTWTRGDDSELQVAGRKLRPEDAALAAERLSGPVALADLIASQSGLVILGDPGSGKTTFLKHLTLQLAAAYAPGKPLPVLVPISAYANALAQQDVRMDDFISTYFHTLGADFPLAGFLGQALRAGKAVVMLDGLDEIKDADLRHTVVQRVVQFYNLHRGGSSSGNRFLITSRIVGYREVRLVADGLAECTLLDFDDAELEAFARQWTLALEKAARGQGDFTRQEAEREQRELLETVQRNPGVRRLAANPLLLTILALMKRQGITLPERRVELYHKCCEVLVSSWNRARSLGRPFTRGRNDFSRTLTMLASLARWMHRKSPGVGLVRRDDLVRELTRLCRLRRDPDPDQAAEQFLEDARANAGLLLERGPGRYGFIHLTFEEYLAAVGVALLGQRRLDPVIRFLLLHLPQPLWREVALLTIGYLAMVQQREEAASDVVTGLLEARVGEPGAAVVLAGEAVLDVLPGGVTAACLERTVTALVEVLQDDRRVAPVIRAQAGGVLGRLGDPRPGVGLRPDGLPDIDWIELPAGLFLMGDARQPVNIPQPYRISRYPVTVGQYGAFVKAGGYGEEGRKYWTQAGWAWKTIKGPEHDEAVYQTANHPRVGVSWYEAVAFCRWLSERLREMPGWEAGMAVRLPSEVEWERAARHTDGREYPWGNQPEVGQRCNIGETGIGHTSAVGMFPSGAAECGAMDLAGNVWEWCRTKSEHPADDELEGDKLRVLRGGSWYDVRVFARCALRNGYNPDYRVTYVGFRVVVSPSGSDSEL